MSRKRRYVEIIILVIYLFVFTGCKRDSSLYATLNAHPELKRLLEHYESDPKRLEAAKFIIRNIDGHYSINDDNNALIYNIILDSVEQFAGINYKADLRHSITNRPAQRDCIRIYDTENISVDSLITSIDRSFEVWAKVPWAKEYSFDQFCNYVLPYRVSCEPLEFYWKEDCQRRFGHLFDESVNDPLEVARRLNEVLTFDFNPTFFGAGLQSYSSIMRNQRGRCDDGAMLRVMILRALGIPAAIDFVPYWGSNNNGHSMAVIITPDGRCHDIETAFKPKGDDFRLGHKTPKIYRRTFAAVEDVLSLYYEDEIIPVKFKDFRSFDVTDQYPLDVRNVTVICDKPLSPIMYLTVFSRSGWQPVAYSESKDSRVLFTNIGTGRAKGTEQFSGVDIGDGIVYLSAFLTGQGSAAVGYPFILSVNSRHELIPDHDRLRQITLTRKYPAKSQLLNFARNMSGGVFEGANKADFSDADTLYVIRDLPPLHTSTVELQSSKTYKYFRYRKGKGAFTTADLAIFDKTTRQIDGKIIASESLNGDPSLKNLFDNSPLTYFELPGIIDAWVGLAFEQPSQIAKITFCPRTDDNNISPDDLYELFYWDGDWVSLGRKHGATFEIDYDNVPDNALLWLRNLSKGIEERPFTYENGRQIWW